MHALPRLVEESDCIVSCVAAASGESRKQSILTVAYLECATAAPVLGRQHAFLDDPATPSRGPAVMDRQDLEDPRRLELLRDRATALPPRVLKTNKLSLRAIFRR